MPEVVNDLPAGASSDPARAGFSATVVNGETVLRDGSTRALFLENC